MLKHLYKTFKISILCGSLLTFQTSVALAAGTTSTDKNGVITHTENHRFEKVSDIDMLASMSMLAGGFIAGRMIKSYRPLTMDVAIAGAAGATFIAGEVISNVKFKGTIDEMTVEVQKKSDGTINEEQIQRLQDLRKSYEEAKNTTKIKKTLQLAAAVGFGAAAAAAIYLHMTEDGQVNSCKAMLRFTDVELQACALDPNPLNTEKLACSACARAFTEYDAKLNKYIIERAIPNFSASQDKRTDDEEKDLLSKKFCTPAGGITKSAISKVSEVCPPAVTALIRAQTSADLKKLNNSNGDVNQLIHKLLKDPLYAQAFENQFHSQPKNYFETALSLFFPKAEASWLPLLGLSAGVAAIFIPATAVVAAEIDLLMYVPKNRAIAFGLFATTSYLASKSSENVMEKLDENIKKIDAILGDLSKMASGIQAQNLRQQQISINTNNLANQTVATFSTNGTLATDCLASSGSNNCTSVSESLKSMPGYANLPDSFKNIATQVTGLGDSVSGKTGISGSTLSSAETLAGKQNAVSKLLASRQLAMEKLSNGKLNFAKEEQNLLNRLNAKNKKALQQGGMTATGFMASIGGTTIPSKLEKVDDKNTIKKTAATSGAIDLSAGTNQEKDNSLNLDFKEAPTDIAPTELTTAAPTKPTEYEINSNEINGKNGPTLFEVISGRYIKSGYPKLLEEEPVKN